ncbi:MAG: phospholipase [Actinomycetota bacterium]|nr:phospholipase [Actinomycetota bacterium]
MRRLWCTVLVVAALALYATPAHAEDATAEQAPDAATLVSLFPDGGRCTGVPDAIPGIFDFTNACANHDACYASHEQTQAECDQAFLADMVAACVAQHPSALDARRYACFTFAGLYFTGVRLFGQFFF